jgi:carboxyl-terminal processing protease
MSIGFAMRSVLPLLLVGLGVFHGRAESAPPPMRDPVLTEVIEVVKAKALNASAVDWPVLERDTDALMRAQSGEEGRTVAIRRVLAALADGHSTYRPPAQTSSSPSAGADVSSVRRPDANPPPPIAAFADDGPFGRLILNRWSGPNDAVPVATSVVRDTLAKAVAVNPCGLIIDLSTNSGGNMWPMMGGIAPLYDEGTLETFENRHGDRQAVNVRDGVLRMNNAVFPRVDGLVSLPTAPKHIAILLGTRTASSGEITALGFKGQGNVRFFGRPTAGATTANTSIRLSNGGQLALTTARILDRSGTHHQGPVLPDVVSDAPARDAAAWLGARCR